MLNKCMVSVFTGKWEERTVCHYFSTFPHLRMSDCNQAGTLRFLEQIRGHPLPTPVPEDQHGSQEPRELGPLTSCVIEAVGKIIKC